MSMKNLLEKMTQLSKINETPKPPKKKVLKESAQVASAKPSSLRELFNQLDEAMAPGQKPLPVLDPQNKQAGAGFVTSTNPAVQNMLKNLDPKDVQIAMAPGKPGVAAPAAGQMASTAGGTGQAMQEDELDEYFSYDKDKTSGRTGQQGPKDVLSLRGGMNTPIGDKEAYKDVVTGRKSGSFDAKKHYGAGGPKGVLPEGELDEKWSGDAEVKSTGQYAGKSVAELKSALSKLKASGPHHEGTPENKRMKQLMFAIRAKKDWKGGIEEGDLPSSSGVDTRGAGLGAGRSQATFESKDSKDHKFEVCYTTTSDKEVKTTITASSVKEATAKIEKKHNFKSLDSVKKVKEEKKEVKEAIDPAVKEKEVNKIIKKLERIGADDVHEPDALRRVAEFIFGKMVQGMSYNQALVLSHKINEGTKGVNPFAKKESMKKAAADKKKKTVKESMSHRMQAARLEGKAHGLKGHAHNGKHYEDMEEARCYHEGYKEGLDECHGMMPGMGLVGEAGMPPATTGGMADQEMDEGKGSLKALAGVGLAAALATGAGVGKNIYDYHHKDASGYSQSDYDKILGTSPAQRDAQDWADKEDADFHKLAQSIRDEVDEGNAFTKALARTPKGGKFKVAGNTFTDTSGYDAQLDEYTFESLDRQLDALLNEGVSVSISRGQENAPNSVTITAQDAEADELLSLVRNAGMGGIFGGDEGSDDSFGMPHPHEMGGASEINTPGQIEVVDDHEGMLALMKKLSGVQSSGPAQDFGGDEEGSDDYESEEGSEDHESEECPSCGHADCHCDDEQVDEMETDEQEEFEVAEDTGADNTNADAAGQVGTDEALAKADAGEDEEEGEEDESIQECGMYEDDMDEEEDLTEWANDAGGNGTETTFEQDIDFMTRVISGGLNKQKSTGQATIPVIPGQKDRMGYSAVNESISDWAKLAGIKKN
jgi:hypothetical protein